MTRKMVVMGTRYSLWDAIPAVYRDYYEDLARRLEQRLLHASGSELERVDRQLTSVRRMLDGEAEDFFTSFVGSFDALLAPIHAVVEDLDLYLDPRTCPPDFLPWLSGWLGLGLNERWPITRRREFVARAVEVFKLRGTVRGVRQAVELYTGVTPTVEDSGGAVASLDALGPLPGSPVPHVTVTVAIDGDPPIDLALVHEIVESVKPAHVATTVRAA